MSTGFQEQRTSSDSAQKAAKRVREKWKDKQDSRERAEAFSAVTTDLDDVIAQLEEWSHSSSPFEVEAKKEIGDCLGAKGGAYRDWGKFADAARAYDEGLRYEVEANEPNSYCLVQRLTMRVLAEPEKFVRSEPVLGLDVSDELLKAAAVIHAQLQDSRRDDPWAQTDFALVLQLLGPKGYESWGADGALDAWDTLDDMEPAGFLYESTLDVVRSLRQRLSPHVDEQAKAEWEDLESRLGG